MSALPRGSHGRAGRWGARGDNESMGPGQRRSPAVDVAATALGSLSMGWTDASVAAEAAWDRRLYAGLRVASVAAEAREGLAEALGEVGVEAEFFLLLVHGFGGPGLHPHARGESFLLRLEAAGRRIWRAGAALEVAAQSYMTALEASYPGLRAEAERADPWWAPFAGYVLPGEPVELRLRRCGYAYRHVVAAHLGLTLEAIAEQMALLLHALNTLPPAGILPTSALYAGLYELTSGLQGYTIPTHIAASDAARLGLLAGIPRLRALDTREDTTLAAD